LRCGDGREKFLAPKMKARESNGYRNITAQVSFFYRIPSPQLLNTYTYRQIMEMYADIKFVQDKADKK